MDNIKVLWADDEINLLKPHVLFLQEKGMQVKTVTNGEDAIDAVQAEPFDIIFLDEHMSGISGLEALAQIKTVSPLTPVVMITKSEEEHVMEDAIGSKIADYLIKPVKPNQILLSCKKLLQGKTIVSQKANQSYQQDFRNISMAFFDDMSPSEWIDIYRKLVYWELELEQNEDKSMIEVLTSQKAEANVNFSRFITQNYMDWMASKPGQRPTLSYDLMNERILPEVDGKEPLFVFLIDCLRFDQWKTFERILGQFLTIQQEDCYFSILPTATNYARNAFFAGMTPLQISEKYSRYWVRDDEEGGKNLHEADFLQEVLVQKRFKGKHSYHKVLTQDDAKLVSDSMSNLLANDLNVIVINFIDTLAHARSEMNIIKELIPDEAALRSLSRSWLEHSFLLQILRRLSQYKARIIITTDHGSIRVNRPLKIIGDRNTTTNLRYKQGRNLNYDYDSRQIFTIKDPRAANLPQTTLSSTYAFACEDTYFVYPNNYNHFVNHYRNTLQHGGVSLEEMIVPFVQLRTKV